MNNRLYLFTRVICSLFVACVMQGSNGRPIGAATISLSGPNNVGNVQRFVVTPDGQAVVFASDERTPGVRELYWVSMAGGLPVRLTTELTATQRLTDFEITPDGRWLLYSVVFPQDTYQPYDQKAIYRHPLDNSQASVRLTQDLSPDGYIMFYGFAVSSDGQYIVYRVCYTSSTAGCEIFSAPIDSSSPPIKLNKPLPTGGTIWDYRTGPDSQWVVYRGEQDTDGKSEIYSVPITGPASLGKKLNSPLVGNSNVFLPFFIDPTGSWVLYEVYPDVGNVMNLYSAPIDGLGSSVRLNLLPLSGYTGATSNGTVVYAASDPSAGKAVYSVPISGPAQVSIQLSGPVSPGYQIQYSSVAATWQYVIYTACTNCSDINPLYETYSAPLSGPASASVRLSAGLATRGALVTQDNQSYLYSTSDGVYRVPLNGPMSNTTKLSDVAGGLFLSPDSWRIIIRAGNRTLNSLPLFGTYTQTLQISEPTIPDIIPYQTSFSFSPDGSQVIYMANNSSGHTELYATDEGYFLNQHIYLPILTR